MILGTDHYWRDWTIPDGQVYSPPRWDVQITNGVRFTWLKAADGIESSLHFEKAFRDARAAGLLVGAYVWLDARNYADPKRQAEFWYSVLRDLNCPLSIDFELYKENVPNWRDLYDATMYYRQLDPFRNVGVYTNYWYWIEHGSPEPIFNQILDFNWSARYFYEPPQLYAPFNRTDVWQFSGLGDPVKYGITNGKEAVDENWWMGDEESLIRFFNQDESIPPIEPPTEEPMRYKITITWDAGSNVRTVPSAASSTTIIRTLKDNAVVESAQEPIFNAEGTWYKISDGYICTVYFGSVRAIVEPITEPPPASLPEIHYHFEAAGYPALDGTWRPL